MFFNFKINKSSLGNKAPTWEKRLRLFLEIIIFYVAIFQILFNSFATGVFILSCLFLILFPRLIPKNKVQHIPIEIEILLFIMVVFQYILGEIHDFYNKIPYYDKIVHFMLPMFVGIIGFLIAYTMHVTGRLKSGLLSTIIIISLISLGIGALWEIIEYLNDVIIFPFIPWHHFQGNLQQDPNTDTMTDLIDDFMGGVFGAILGLIFINRNGNSARMGELTHELNKELFERK